MYPYFVIFGKVIGTYTLFSLMGILCAGVFAYESANKRGISSTEITIMLLYSLTGGLLGAHVLYAVTNIDLLIVFVNNLDKIDSFSMLLNCLAEIFGGAVFYGGLIGGLITGYIYIRKRKLDMGQYSDIAAASIPLMHLFGRIGCFFGGCCYGVECNVGFTYTHSLIVEANGVRRFPIQLTEAVMNLLIFLVLLYMLKKLILRGRLIYFYLLIYPVIRFVLEFWRGDDIRGFILGLSTSQFISVFLFAFASVMLVKKAAEKKKGT